MEIRAEEISQIIRREIEGFDQKVSVSETGTVLEAGDGIVSPDWAQVAAPRYLNYRKTSIYGGSNEVQRTIIASTILGL